MRVCALAIGLGLLCWLPCGCRGRQAPALEKFHIDHRADARRYVDVDAVVLLDKQRLTYSFSVDQWKPYAELTHHRRIHVLKPGALSLRRIHIPYDRTSGILDVQVRITHPDGSTEDLGEVPTLDFNRFKPGHPASGLYNEPAAKVFVAPMLQVDDVIEYRYRRVLRDASWVEPMRLGGPYPIQRGELSIVYPQDFDVDFRLLRDEKSLAQKPQRLPDRVYADPTDRSGKGVPATKLLWVFENLPALYPEPLRPADEAIATQLHVQFKSFYLGQRAFTGFSTWMDVARWYGRIIGSADAVDSSAQRLIQTIGATRGKPKMERMRLINRWLADNVVPIKFDGSLAALKVHGAASVLATRAGDSKDIANAGLALLRASGIEAFPVLCSRRGTRAVATDLPTPAAFNSVVVAVAVGGGYRYFAPDGFGLPTGRLPWRVQGSRGLLIRPSGAELVQLPVDDTKDNRREIDINLSLQPDGSAAGSAVIRLSGQDAGLARLVFRWLPPEKRAAFFSNYIVDLGSALHVASVQAPAKDDGDKPFRVLATIVAPSLATPGPNGLRFRITDLAGQPLAFLWRESRRTPIDLGYRFTERRLFSVSMADGTGVLQQPRERKRDGDLARIEDRFAPADGKARMLRRRTNKVIRVDKTNYSAFRGFYQALWQHQEQIFVVGPGGDRGVDYQGDAF